MDDAASPPPPPPAEKGTDPSTFLSDIIGNPVTVKLNSGVIYKGGCCGGLPALWGVSTWM
jgi:hypothetical protein